MLRKYNYVQKRILDKILISLTLRISQPKVDLSYKSVNDYENSINYNSCISEGGACGYQCGYRNHAQKDRRILDCVYLKGDEYIIKRKNKSLAALIPVAKLIALNEAANSFLLQFMEKQGAELTVYEMNRLLEEAKADVRKKPLK